jgi:thymidylate kinase
MYEEFKNQNIVTDRHFASNYAWSGNVKNDDVYDFLIKKIGKPLLTVILYAPPSVIKERLSSRCKTDSDLKKLDRVEEIYKKMIDFCMKKGLPHLVIDTSNLSPEEITEKIISKVWYELWKK